MSATTHTTISPKETAHRGRRSRDDRGNPDDQGGDRRQDEETVTGATGHATQEEIYEEICLRDGRGAVVVHAGGLLSTPVTGDPVLPAPRVPAAPELRLQVPAAAGMSQAGRLPKSADCPKLLPTVPSSSPTALSIGAGAAASGEVVGARSFPNLSREGVGRTRFARRRGLPGKIANP